MPSYDSDLFSLVLMVVFNLQKKLVIYMILPLVQSTSPNLLVGELFLVSSVLTLLSLDPELIPMLMRSNKCSCIRTPALSLASSSDLI